MKATFGTTKKGTWAYIQKSVRIDGKSTTKTVRRLGLLEDIRRKARTRASGSGTWRPA